MAFSGTKINTVKISNVCHLHTIMETLLEDISFEADEHAGETISIDSKYVDEKLTGIFQDQDLSKYIL